MSPAETLFDLGAPSDEVRRLNSGYGRQALVQRPVRNQVYLPAATLDELIEPEHAARAMWTVVESLDVSALEAENGSNAFTGGRPAVDVRVMLGLWLYATTQGEGRASVIAERCLYDAAFQWLCGGIRVSERTLSSFRLHNEMHLDALLTQTIAVLMHEGLVDVR